MQSPRRGCSAERKKHARTHLSDVSQHSQKNPVPPTLDDMLADHQRRVERALELIANGPAPLPTPKLQPLPTGLRSDFGYDNNPAPAGYQASEWEQRLADIRRDRLHAHRSVRRARMRGAQIEPVNRSDIIKRDDSTCHICGKRCDDTDIHLDHVVPLARGGTHTANNLRVAHAYCNLSKGARLLAEIA